MNLKQTKPPTQVVADQSVQHSSLEQPAMQFPHLTEKELKIWAWLLRHPGERVEIEDDDVAFEEGTESHG